MNIYVPYNKEVAPSVSAIEDVIKSFLRIHEDDSFLCNNPSFLDFLPKSSLIYIDKDGNKHNWLEYFGEGIPSEQYIKATKSVKLDLD